MGDIYINENLAFRIHNHGLPNVEHRLVLREARGGEMIELVSAPLSDVHLGILGTQATGAYFARTGRPVWPVIDTVGADALEEAAALYDNVPAGGGGFVPADDPTDPLADAIAARREAESDDPSPEELAADSQRAGAEIARLEAMIAGKGVAAVLAAEEPAPEPPTPPTRRRVL